MKKGFTAFLAVIVFAVMSCVVINSEDVHKVEIHSHAHAGPGDVKWQCRQCGMQAQYTGSSSHPSEFGCDVSQSGQHVWEKIYAGGSRPVNWQCIKCGERTWIASLPNEFGCSRNKSRMHVWQRQD